MIGSIGQGTACAGMRPPSPTQMLQRMDANADGNVDATELQAMADRGPANGPSATELLDRFDTDGNGGLDLDELTAMDNAHRADFESRRATEDSTAGDLLGFLQSEQGQDVLSDLLSQLVARYGDNSVPAAATGATSKLDVAG